MMKNFNIRYECLDARDHFRAQLKKGAATDLFGSWEKMDAEDDDCGGVCNCTIGGDMFPLDFDLDCDCMGGEVGGGWL